jgi:hypothetical protein
MYFFKGFHPIERVRPRKRGPLVRRRSHSLILGLDCGALRQKVRKKVELSRKVIGKQGSIL